MLPYRYVIVRGKIAIAIEEALHFLLLPIKVDCAHSMAVQQLTVETIFSSLKNLVTVIFHMTTESAEKVRLVICE